MPFPRNVILTGFMGSGKTSVGRRLAALLHWRFVDVDRLVERRAGRSIRALFRARGERAFRDLEHRVIRGLPGLRRRVIATGGGAPVFSRNRAWLRRAGLVVHLAAPATVLARRIGGGRNRPLLARAGRTSADRLRLIRAMLRARAGAYRTADLTVAAGRGTPAAVAARVRRRLPR